MARYAVKMSSDGIGWYVVEVISDIEMRIMGTSLVRQEMADLAYKLNKEQA